jgi:hypothetical protein
MNYRYGGTEVHGFTVQYDGKITSCTMSWYFSSSSSDKQINEGPDQSTPNAPQRTIQRAVLASILRPQCSQPNIPPSLELSFYPFHPADPHSF